MSVEQTKTTQPPPPLPVRGILIGTAIFFTLFTAAHLVPYFLGEPMRRQREIGDMVMSLVDRRPPEITRGQWGSAVAWTRNLIGNSMLLAADDMRPIADFQKRLQEKLNGKVDMTTIDWIWEECARLTPQGANYQKFRPVMLEEIAEVGPDNDIWNTGVK